MPVEFSLRLGSSGTTSRRLIPRMLRRKWTVILVFILIAGVTVPLIWTLTVPMYKARAYLIFKPRIKSLVFKTEESDVMPLYSSFLNTQVIKIQQPDVLSHAVDPQVHPEIAGTDWYKNNDGSFFRPPMDPASRLQEALSVNARRESQVIEVTVTAENKELAQMLVNAVVDEYRKLDRDMKWQAEQRVMRTLSRQYSILRSEIDTGMDLRTKILGETCLLSDPEELRNDYARRVRDMDAEYNSIARKLALDKWQFDLIEGMTEAQRPQVQDARDEGQATRQPPPEHLQFAGDPQWQQLKGVVDSRDHQLEIARTRYDEADSRLKDLEADVQFARDRLEQHEKVLRDRLALSGLVGPALGTPGLTARQTFELAIKRTEKEVELLERDLKAEKEQARRDSRLAYEVAKRDLEIQRKRELLDRIQEKIDLIDMEWHNPLGRITTVPAVMPRRPSEDRRIIMTLMALIVALGVGMGLAFLRALRDTSLSRADEVTSTARVPIEDLKDASGIVTSGHDDSP